MTRILTSAGNPAAVCLLSDDIADELKQQIATEMNLSETAFVIPRERFETMIAQCTECISCIYVKCYLVCLSTKGEGDPFATGSRFGLRWFTPTTEVPLCGHATLASASVLFYKRGNQQAISVGSIHFTPTLERISHYCRNSTLRPCTAASSPPLASEA